MTATPGRNDPAGLSIIAAGTVVTGDVRTDGVVKVEGQVIGNVDAKQQVLVARGGSVQGDLRTDQAVIGGTVTGTVVAISRAEIQGSAVVDGDLTTRRLVVLEGGRLNGALDMKGSE
jgi:cytoskeletal protein CcmA (bactofilin family)